MGAADKLVTLSNQEGTEIRCSITGFYNGELSLKREDGATFKYPIELLNEASQKIARDEARGLFPASIEVRSTMTSSRESKYTDSYGQEHRTGTKRREFGCKVKTFSPVVLDVTADCFFFDGSGWKRSQLQGKIKDDSIWEFSVGNSTNWHAIQYQGWKIGRSTDYQSGSSRIDLVIFLRNKDGKVLDQYATSRYAEQLIEENVIDVEAN